MTNGTFQNLSTFVSPRQLGLGWMSGISVLETDHAVTTDWHRHSTTEMLMCIRGETRYEFKDRPPVTLCAGSFLIIPGGTEHRVSNAIDEPGKRIGFNLHNTSDPRSRFAVFSSRDYVSFLHRLAAMAFQPRPCPGEMRRTLAKIECLVGTRHLSSVEYGHLRILCCTILYEAVLPPAPRPESQSKLMDQAVKWLEAHFTEDVSMERLIAFMGYSRARLFTLFREHTGTSPNEYLQRLRIRKAKDMLSGGTMPSKAIANACGFADKGYFTRVFKRQTGHTPLDYRRLFQHP